MALGCFDFDRRQGLRGLFPLRYVLVFVFAFDFVLILVFVFKSVR